MTNLLTTSIKKKGLTPYSYAITTAHGPQHPRYIQ